MPRLVFSSEKAGCGATIELDNGETCLISVAQSGVLVRSYKKGILSGVLGSFFGPILYSEKNVYRAAKTAAALDKFTFVHYPSPCQTTTQPNSAIKLMSAESKQPRR
jgi:hypothetical protein